MIGGTFAFSANTGVERDTGDIDIKIPYKDHPTVLKTLSESGYTLCTDRSILCSYLSLACYLIFSLLLSVQQAADYLGVHAGTVRRWAYAKRIKGTKIGIRGDWRFTEDDLLMIARTDNFSATLSLTQSPLSLSPTQNWTIVGDSGHFVQFYEDEAFLVKVIKEFISGGDTAVVLVTPLHKLKLEEGLELYGLELAAAREKGVYICLDAEETLSKFMRSGMPDSHLFFRTIEDILAQTSGSKRKLRVFGEMVALLWNQGNQEAAIQLEELWNELAQVHVFSLFCAYPIHGFGRSDHAIPFEQIQKTHSHVFPSESYTSLSSENTRLREIALLQQKAKALEAEIVNHKKTEEALFQTLAALKVSEDFNRRVIENSADCIKILDLAGKLLSMNQPGCSLLEIDDLSLYLGKDYLSFWKEDYRKEISLALTQASEGGIGRFQGFCPTAKGRAKWWDVVITPIYDNQGNVDRLLAISRDITLTKELEQRKDDFLSATSHELKTPLTSQKAFIQLLQHEIKDNNEEKYRRYVTKINEQTNKLTKLVTDLLDVSKMQAGKLVLNSAPFDINLCVLDAVEEIQAISPKHTISIKGKIAVKVVGDKEKVSQVIINLLTNAVKYSPQADRITVLLKRDTKSVIISVQDFGIGIDEKVKDKVFERFYRVSDSDQKTYPGLGMGLYIASEIVKQHRGAISVDSVKGKGSLFRFSLPLGVH